jgi:uncharacterized protein YjdB
VNWRFKLAKRLALSKVGFLTALLIGACSADRLPSGPTQTDTPPTIASITIVPPIDSTLVGGSLRFTAIAKDANGRDLGGADTWTTSDAAVAIVDSTGAVAALAPGDAIVSARRGAKSANASLHVRPLPVASLTISPASPAILVGGSMQLTATAYDSVGRILTGRAVTWASGRTSVATVSTMGLVTGVAAGSAQVMATSEGRSSTAVITVTAIPPAPVATVSVSPSTPSMQAGATVQLTATARDAAGQVLTGRVVTWASGNTPVATVTATGLVTGVAAGSAQVTATSEGRSSTAVITVTAIPPAPVATVSVSPSAPSVQAGATVQLTATARDAAGQVLTGRVVTWASGNTPVATVTATGLVTGVAAGSAQVTATSEGRSSTAVTTVTAIPPAPVATVSVSPSAPSVQAGATVQLTATTRDAAGQILTGRVVTWASGNSAVATVTATGLVMGVAAGSAQVTATSEGRSSTAVTTVTAIPPAPVAAVSVSPSAPSVQAGATVQLTATTRDAAGQVLTGRVVTWASANSAVATVSATGLVRGVAAGASLVTATSEGRTGTSAITVGGSGASRSEPVDPGSSYLWADNFDRYTSAAAMIANGGCGAGTDAAGLPSATATYGQRTMPNSNDGCNLNNDGMSLTTGRGGSGRALRATVLGGTNQANYTWLSPWVPNGWGTYSGALVIQFYFRPSPGGTPGSNGTKFIEAWFSSNDPRTGNAQRIQAGLDRGTNARPLWSAVLGQNPGGTINRTTQFGAPFWDALNDGNWHRFTFLLRMNTTSTYSNTGGTSSTTETYSGTSSRDGMIRMWVDGTEILDYSQSAVGVTCSQGDVDMIPPSSVHLAYLKFPDVFNNTPAGNWTLDHDDLKVWTIP